MNPDQLTLAEIRSLLDVREDDERGGPDDLTKSAVEIHQIATDRFAAALSELIGERVVAKVVGSKRMTCGEFLLGIAKPSYFHPAKAGPNLTDLVLETPAAAAGLLLDGLLGTDRTAARIARLPATETEQRLFRRVTAMFWQSFHAAWSGIAQFDLTAEGSTNDCRSVRLAQPDDEVNLVEYCLSVGQHAARFRCCLPADWLARLLAHGIADQQGTSAGDAASQTAGVALEVIVPLAETVMPSRELANLRVGDVIATGKDVGEPLDVAIDGTVAFRANLDKAGNKKAVRIVEKVPRAALEENHSSE